MTIKIGWSPSEIREALRGGHAIPAVFSYLKVNAPAARRIVVGYVPYSRATLEELRGKGVNDLRITVVGALRFKTDVTPDLIKAVVGQTKVFGATFARPDVRAVLNMR